MTQSYQPPPGTYQPSPQKLQLATEITKLESDLRLSEINLREAERQMAKAKSSRTAGLVAILVALVLGVALIGLWPLWAFLFVIGVLTAITGAAKSSTATRNRAYNEKTINTIQDNLSQARMHFGMMQ